ncbi:putative WD repeat region containing protein [Phytophthora infestans]|uniref:Putative WD domain G-beta repeat domain-containing protein n=1 Tax=Phytophthora infestans TaxID=4787 RepID=A0A833TMP5_PHYIN|nr:putative WD repeat region containing protein [Phytophthora infestans]KAF4134253.1 putative WD domain G-beta repeat domain-containing protein [Phytophthora infestans]
MGATGEGCSSRVPDASQDQASQEETSCGGKEEGKEPDSARDGKEQEDDDDEEEDEAEDYDEDDDDDAEEEEDACPSGCDLTLYEKVLTLREKRADVDDAMGELNKAIEELRKAGERQTAEQRAINKELAATEQDTQQFQSNQLDVVVPLSTRQLCCLQAPSPTQQNWTLPAQAAGCLVFTTRAFSALSERIESLQAETKKLRQQFRDLHKQQNVLAKEKRQQQEAIARAQDRSEQLMRLKFGQLVDLEVLDRACDASLVTRGRR